MIKPSLGKALFWKVVYHRMDQQLNFLESVLIYSMFYHVGGAKQGHEGLSGFNRAFLPENSLNSSENRCLRLVIIRCIKTAVIRSPSIPVDV